MFQLQTSFLMTRGISRRAFIAAALVLVAAAPSAWAERRESKEKQKGKADLSRLVVVGDSLSAGYQGATLRKSGQENSYAAMLARQAGVVLTLPLVSEDGIPRTVIVPGAPPVQLPLEPAELMTARLLPGVQATNLAVPGAKVADVLSAVPLPPNMWGPNPGPVDVYSFLVLGIPGLSIGQQMSQMQWAIALNPSTLLVWTGSNDVLLSAVFGGTHLGATDPLSFLNSYRQVMALAKATGATVITANIPDVTHTAVFVTKDQLAALLPPGAIAALGIPNNSYVNLAGLGDVQKILAGVLAPPLADIYVLTPFETEMIRLITAAYNGIIKVVAEENGAPVVDIYSLVERIHDRGYVVNGQRLTTDYLGGLFSLDGVHPGNTGHAILANEFIKTMNSEVAAGIPPVNVGEVAKTDPMVIPGAGHPASALEAVPAAQ